MSEQDSYNVTLQRVQKVFQGVQLVEQQRPSLERLLDKAITRNAPNPIPEAELEGIKELVTEHLWHPELTRQLNKSKDSTPTSSETSGSSSAPADPMLPAVNELKDKRK